MNFYHLSTIIFRAAAKFMKKEVDKYRQGPVNSGFGKRLVKDINQEIFGLKTIQGHGQLKKVERKRLADLILDPRKASWKYKSAYELVPNFVK